MLCCLIQKLSSWKRQIHEVQKLYLEKDAVLMSWYMWIDRRNKAYSNYTYSSNYWSNTNQLLRGLLEKCQGKKKKKNPSFWDVATLANDNQILASEWTAHGLISTMIGSLTFQVLDRRKSHEHNGTTVMDDVPETASTGNS